jgi:hypothetical protein
MWQQFLASRRLYSRPTTGEFDNATEAATREYQHGARVGESGVVDRATLDRARGDGFVLPVDTGSGQHYTLGPHVELSNSGRTSLRRIADEYYIRTCGRLEITSGTRTPAEQAQAMWENLRHHRNSHVRYRNDRYYQEIHDAYLQATRSGANERETVEAMTRVIERQVSRGEYLSLHLRGEAVDVRSRTLTPVQTRAFQEAVNVVLGSPPLVEEDHYHIQF